MKSLTQLFLTFLITLKIILGSVFIYLLDIEPFFLETKAIASETRQILKETAKFDSNDEKNPLNDLSFIMKKKVELEKEAANIANKKEELLIIQKNITMKGTLCLSGRLLTGSSVTGLLSAFILSGCPVTRTAVCRI